MSPRSLALLMVIGVLLLIAGGSWLSHTLLPRYFMRPLSDDYLQSGVGDGSVLAWIPYWDQERAKDSLRRNAEQIDFVGVFWYALMRDGTLGQYPYAVVDSELIAFAHARDIKVLAVIANLPTEVEKGDWDAGRVRLVTTSAERRLQHIEDIIALVDKENFDGVNIDYEALERDQRDDFTLFIAELADALHSRGKILGVSLHPKFEENNVSYSNGSQAQDYEALARLADHLYVMTYEQHWETSDPGPIASIAWIKPILDFARRRVPQAQLFAGLPLYGYDWGSDGGPAAGLTYEDIVMLRERHGAHSRWDEESREKRFFYTDTEGTEHEVWYQDGETVAAKRDVFKNLGIVNVALWRIGGEDPEVWQSLP